MSSPIYLRRRGAAEYLRHHWGIPCSEKTLAKLAISKDTPADLRMAHDAGARAIGVASGIASITELTPDADIVVDSVAALVSIAPG
jgi:ribonucleotide monophosphatase NagD (HAD superfamily)